MPTTASTCSPDGSVAQEAISSGVGSRTSARSAAGRSPSAPGASRSVRQHVRGVQRRAAVQAGVEVAHGPS